MTPEQKKEHDLHMAETPKQYRGLILRPISHAKTPYYDAGVTTFWGWGITDHEGVNRAPGCTWSRTLEGASDIVDAIHEAGGYDYDTGREVQAPEWGETFWKVLRDQKGKLTLSTKEGVGDFVRKVEGGASLSEDHLFDDDGEYRGTLLTRFGRFTFIMKDMTKVEALHSLGTTWPELFRKPA